MKKMVSVMTLFCILLGLQTQGFALKTNRSKAEEAVERVKSLNIMTGYEDGAFGEERFLTRSEFAAVIFRILNFDDISDSRQVSKYTDVPEEYWACPDISIVTEFNYMRGYGNGIFGPEENVTYNQTAVVLIKLLGYDVTCTPADGNDYSPYVERASSTGLLKNVPFGGDEPITRENLALMISNALDINVMVIDSLGNYEVSEKYNLFDKFRRDGEEAEGIVEETSETFLAEDNDILEDEVIINGYRYNTGDTNIKDYLGMSVHYFVQNTGNDDYVIKGFYPDDNNEIISVTGEDIVSCSGGNLTYLNENDREVKISIAGCRYVCNGRLYYGAPDEILLSPSARIRLINNDRDKDFEFVFAEVYELSQILKNNTVAGSIYLQSTLKNGKRAIEYTDEDVNFVFQNVNGEEILPEELVEKDAWLEIYTSSDGKNMKIIALDGKKTGYVERIDYDDDGSIVIDGTEYMIARDYAGFLVPPKSLEVNRYYEFWLDSFGKIIYAETENEETKTHYGYIYFLSDADNNSDELLKIKLINGTTVRNYEENEKYYIHGNDRQEINTFELAQKVKIDNVYYSEPADISKKLNTVYTVSANGHDKIGNVIRYTLNGNNEINKIDVLSSYGKYASRKLNAEQMVMGGDDTPFGIDEDTIVFFIPKSGEEDDISCEMKFTADSYKSVGFELDEEKYTVDAAVFESPLSVYDDSDFSENERTKVIQAVSSTIDENGEAVYRVSGYAGTEIFNRTTRSGIDSVDSVVSELKRGDVVQFQTDFDGQINRIKKSFSIDTSNEYYHRGAQTAHEIIYGIAASSVKNCLGVGATEFMNQLSIVLDDNGSDETTFQMPVKASTAPDIYIYYSDQKMVSPGDFDDIVTMNEVGNDYASRVILYACNSVVKSILIIK